MAGINRVLHKRDYQRPVQLIKIVGACDAPPRCVEVTLPDGRIVRLPCSQCQFSPGHVVVPTWLFDKIFTRDRGNAPQAPHPAGRSQPSCPR